MPYTRPVVEVAGLHKSFGDAPVLAGVDLTVEPGTVFALLGPNGAGKTTTVRILSTLLSPDRGRALVAGHDVARAPALVRRAISLTGQYAAVDELLTGAENLRMMCRLRHLERSEARRRTDELLDRFDLTGAANRRVKTYSGGMRRRLDLAMSLVHHPQVLFLDEPTTGLDPRSRIRLWDVIGDLVTDGVTIFLTTQYLEEADRLADTVAVIHGGRVVAEGSADELKRRVGSEQLELVLVDEADGEPARRAVDAPVLLGAGERSLKVATDGTAAHVRHILNRLEDEGVAVASVSLRRPSLDDVFLTLTDEVA